MLPLQDLIAKFFSIGTVQDARNLLRRIQEVESFNLYVRRNIWLVILATVVIVITGFACLLGIFTLLPDLHWIFVLPLLVLLPIFLGGSLFVETFVFVSWIEGRCLALELGNRHKPAPGPLAIWLQKKFRLDMSPFPPVPWILATVFLFVPLAMLWHVWSAAALAVIVLAIAMPILYARFDR